jgi:hypothetical protein
LLLKQFAPGIILGLFVGRVAGELWAILAGNTAVILASALSLLGIVGGVWLTRQRPFSATWPLLFLFAYVIYPEANLTAALFVAALSLLVAWQNNGRLQHLFAFPAGRRFIMPLLLLAGLLLLYINTLAPDILPADSGEFQVTAATLGVAHPPGFPLYTMLAHLMTRLPLGPTPAYRVNLLSALTSVLTLTAVFGGTYLLTRRVLPGATAVLILGSATTFWSQATTANIRSMTALFAALILFTALGFYSSRQRSSTPSDNVAADHWLVLFALVLALSITHHASLAFMGLIAVLFLLLVDPSLIRPSSRWLRPALAALLGLLPLLYLPLRAHADVRGASPALATWSGFSEHVLALGFQGDLFVYLEPALLWERLKIMGNVLAFQFSPLLLAGMALGFIVLLRKEWRLGFLLGGSFALFTLVTATYRAPQTVEYMLPAYITLALCAGFAAVGTSNGRISARYVQPTIAALLILGALWQFNQHYPSFAWLHDSYDTRDYANQLAAGTPPDGLILADWHWAAPLWYMQEVEGRRPDADIRFVYPEGEPYGETWARRIADGLADDRPVVSTHFNVAAFAPLPVSEPLGEAFLFRQMPRASLPPDFTPMSILLGDLIQIEGYALSTAEVATGEELVLTLAWQPTGELAPETALFVHLLSGDGRLYGQQDLPAHAQPEGLTLTQFRIVPQFGAYPGSYTLAAGAYAREPLPDEAGAPRTTLATIAVTPTLYPPATNNPLRRTLLDSMQRKLVGYDWDQTIVGRPRLYLHWQQNGGYVSEVIDDTAVTLPPFSGPWGIARSDWSGVLTPANSHYVPLGQGIVWTGTGLSPDQALQSNENLVLTQSFLSSRPVLRDQTVSVRLIGFADGRQWAWWDLDDAIPAMGAIPTLKWIAGSEVRSPHFLTVDSEATAGQEVGGALTLYDAFTERSLPILDDRLNREYGWVPLGEAWVEESP